MGRRKVGRPRYRFWVNALEDGGWWLGTGKHGGKILREIVEPDMMIEIKIISIISVLKQQYS